MDTKYIIIGIVILLLLIIIISIIIKKKRELDKENQVSILDVDLNGVSSSSDRTFDYGYEKEDTVVMEPVKKEKKETKNTKKTTKKK